MTEKTDIVVDLSKITKRQILEWRRGRRKLAEDEGVDPWLIDEYDFNHLYKLVITAWPFGKIDFETFLDLSYPDSVLVDDIVTGTIRELSEKK